MKQRISLTSNQLTILRDLEILAEQRRYEFLDRGGDDIPLKIIKEVCTAALLCANNQLQIGVIERNVLLFAVSLFSNEDDQSLAKRLNRYSKTIVRGHRIGYYEIKNQGKYAVIYLNVLERLVEMCPERLSKMAYIDFSAVQGVEDGNRMMPTDTVSELIDISSISLRTRAWFYNENISYKMLAFTPDSNDVKLITFTRSSDYKAFFLLQLRGIRFMGLREFMSHYGEFTAKRTQAMIERLNEMEHALKTRKQDNSQQIAEGSNTLTYAEILSLAFDIDSDNIMAGLAVAALKEGKKRFKDASMCTFKVFESPTKKIEILASC